jgi:hypothetical protein
MSVKEGRRRTSLYFRFNCDWDHHLRGLPITALPLKFSLKRLSGVALGVFSRGLPMIILRFTFSLGGCGVCELGCLFGGHQ